MLATGEYSNEGLELMLSVTKLTLSDQADKGSKNIAEPKDAFAKDYKPTRKDESAIHKEKHDGLTNGGIFPFRNMTVQSS